MECEHCGREQTSSSCGSSPRRNPFNRAEGGAGAGNDNEDELINMCNSRLEFVDEPSDLHICRTCRSLSRPSLSNSAPPSSVSVDTGASFTARSFRSSSNGSIGGGGVTLDDNHKSTWYDGYVADDADVPLLQEDDSAFGRPMDTIDHCHVQRSNSTSSRAQKQLIISSILCMIFMIAEVIGGYMSHSLAIMTDAAHMFSDLTSFLISLFAIWVGSRPATKKMSFGYYRAEILGALLSVVIIWILTGVLVFMAIRRIIYQDYEIQADIMLVVAGVGVAMNIVMGFVLHSLCQCHTHSHGMSHGHSSSHSHGGSNAQNINVRAAFIHVVGDLLQSVGVLIAAYIIKYKPEYHLADPICTFLFSGLVLITTFSILKDALRVLMEGVPPEMNYASIKGELQNIEGVKAVHSLHIWSLTVEKNALIVHLAIENLCDSDRVLKQTTRLIRKKYHIHQSSVQIELHEPEIMDSCSQCQGP